ncbi:MAG TPA: DUF4395 domain-containing protein [Solirubrobacteraceae bacterium]|nr:DUF4395 domain-containing protein [Solirubrobacteraceae bacterium]
MFAEILSFPNPVNEKAARTVAFVVMLLACVALATSWYWLLLPLAYGFVARVLTGPTLSPLGLLASRVVAPRLGPEKPVPGPPKRFAQAMGATMTIAAAIAALGFDAHGITDVLLVALVLAAGLESILAYCLGCKIFAVLIRAGVVPERVCLECADVLGRSRDGLKT